MAKILIEMDYEVDCRCKNPEEQILKYLRSLKGIVDGNDWELHEWVIKFKDMKVAEKGSSQLKDLGWANGWKETPKIVKKCRKLKHETSDIDHSHMRGLHHEVRCDMCGYVYHYDSSG